MKTLKIILFIIVTFKGAVIAQQNSSTNLKLKEYDISTINRTLADYANTHITDKNADKFIGTWKWNEGSSEFILKLEKGQRNFGSKEKPWLVDQLVGGLEYIKNGTVIINDLSWGKLIGGSQGSANQIFLYYSDEQQHKLLIFEVTMINDMTIKWELTKHAQEWQSPTPNPSLPIELELHKN